MATIQITIPDSLALVARSAGLLTSEKMEVLLREQLDRVSVSGAESQASDDDGYAAEREALERLIRIARGDTGQSRRVADFLLAWWNSGACGSFDLTNLWGVDTTIATDMVKVFAYIAVTNRYPDTLGYAKELEAIVHEWRPELK